MDNAAHIRVSRGQVEDVTQLACTLMASLSIAAGESRHTDVPDDGILLRELAQTAVQGVIQMAEGRESCLIAAQQLYAVAGNIVTNLRRCPPPIAIPTAATASGDVVAPAVEARLPPTTQPSWGQLRQDFETVVQWLQALTSVWGSSSAMALQLKGFINTLVALSAPGEEAFAHIQNQASQDCDKVLQTSEQLDKLLYKSNGLQEDFMDAQKDQERKIAKASALLQRARAAANSVTFLADEARGTVTKAQACQTAVELLFKSSTWSLRLGPLTEAYKKAEETASSYMKVSIRDAVQQQQQQQHKEQQQQQQEQEQEQQQQHEQPEQQQQGQDQQEQSDVLLQAVVVHSFADHQASGIDATQQHAGQSSLDVGPLPVTALPQLGQEQQQQHEQPEQQQQGQKQQEQSCAPLQAGVAHDIADHKASGIDATQQHAGQSPLDVGLPPVTALPQPSGSEAAVTEDPFTVETMEADLQSRVSRIKDLSNDMRQLVEKAKSDVEIARGNSYAAIGGCPEDVMKLIMSHLSNTVQQCEAVCSHAKQLETIQSCILEKQEKLMAIKKQSKKDEDQAQEIVRVFLWLQLLEALLKKREDDMQEVDKQKLQIVAKKFLPQISTLCMAKKFLPQLPASKRRMVYVIWVAAVQIVGLVVMVIVLNFWTKPTWFSNKDNLTYTLQGVAVIGGVVNKFADIHRDHVKDDLGTFWPSNLKGVETAADKIEQMMLLFDGFEDQDHKSILLDHLKHYACIAKVSKKQLWKIDVSLHQPRLDWGVMPPL